MVGSGRMSHITNEMKEEKRIARQFSINYSNLSIEEKDAAKLELNKSPCNIWGYIIELEKRIKTLEGVKK